MGRPPASTLRASAVALAAQFFTLQRASGFVGQSVFPACSDGFGNDANNPASKAARNVSERQDQGTRRNVQFYTLRPTYSRYAFDDKRCVQQSFPTITGSRYVRKVDARKHPVQPLFRHGALSAKKYWKISYWCRWHPILRVYFYINLPGTLSCLEFPASC